MPGNLRQRLDELTQKEAMGTISEEDMPRLTRLRHIQKLFRARGLRSARLKALTGREKEGILTSDEKLELTRLRDEEERFASLTRQDREQKATRQRRALESKGSLQTEFERVRADAGATVEYQKHAERVAKLERARVVAKAAQIAGALETINALLAREARRHTAWIEKRSHGSASTKAAASP